MSLSKFGRKAGMPGKPNILLATITVIMIIIALFLEYQNLSYNKLCNEHWQQEIKDHCLQPQLVNPFNINLTALAQAKKDGETSPRAQPLGQP